jgi:G3E family GTPase
MMIHLVGGFSGSGKTTAIKNACQTLKYKNITASVIEDDQVSVAEDKLPAQKNGISLPKVSGGCSSCSYERLVRQIEMLKKKSDPSVIFAECSGTCINLTNTLLKPLREYKEVEIAVVNISVFVDAEFLLLHFQGVDLPLGVEDKYIWEKHIHEAEILIVNKIDLLSDCELEALEIFAKDTFLSKQVYFLDSFDMYAIDKWIEMIGMPQVQKNKSEVSHDEPGLAFLDEEIEISAMNGCAVELTYGIMNNLALDLIRRKLHIDHFQFFLSFNGQSLKFGYKELPDEIVLGSKTFEKSDSVDLLINARVHISPDKLRHILFNVLNQYRSLEGVTIKEKFISYF